MGRPGSLRMRWLAAAVALALLPGCIEFVEEDPGNGRSISSSAQPVPPEIAFAKDEREDKLTVVKAGEDDRWADLAARGTCASDTPTTGRVLAGDVIHMETQPAGTSCDYGLSHKPTNSLLFMATFTF